MRRPPSSKIVEGRDPRHPSICCFHATYEAARVHHAWPLIAGAQPTIVEPDIVADFPSQFLQSLCERCTGGLPQWILSASHSITSSARLSNDCGTVRPSILAVLRLMIISTFVAC
jgi:hypothetical protein